MHFGQWLMEDYKSDKIARQETVETYITVEPQRSSFSSKPR